MNEENELIPNSDLLEGTYQMLSLSGTDEIEDDLGEDNKNSENE